MREPLEPGTKIEFSGIEAEVIEDNGGNILLVLAEGCTQWWEWSMEGEECKVIK